MGCCSNNDEERPVLNVLQNEFRRGRKAEDYQNHELLKQILKHICATLCLYKPSRWGLILGILLASICIFQLVYDLVVVCGCPGFDCGFLEKKLKGDRSSNASLGAPDRKTSNAVYTLASIGGSFSYTLLLKSLLLMYRRQRQGNGQAISPSDALFDDLSNTQVKYIFLSQITLASLFVSAVVMFYYLTRTQPRDGWYYYLMIFGVAAQFMAQWAAIVGCHAFAIASLALGTLANDTVRRVKEIGKEKKQARADYGTDGVEKASTSKASKRGVVVDTKIDSKAKSEGIESEKEQAGGSGSPVENDADETKVVVDPAIVENVAESTNDFDIAFEYHEELCVIVSDTVEAYCLWFVMHWLCYGATCLIGVIYISEELAYSSNLLKLAYISVFFVTHLYLFLLPCVCAACITDMCGGISARVNKTTSKYWHEDHPFRDRAKLTMFTTYAKDRQCVFKVGRLTFTSTLAWISLLLGSTGLLFHFF
ncbi:uncharacterized protein LOC114539320 [Dendronephthya gigantea]|uniref:uncharacterized protein LOC114539320 n=1 Tax=Dendronephthya gigantea TaxID=151771 RepID=UPI00106C13EA|nr:uncharacterized protein LOC114539320 [Dendronephthya gigantea]